MEQENIQNHTQVHREIIQGEAGAGYESLAIESNDGVYDLSVLVSGVHCAGCIQKVESTLMAEAGIQNARLNFSTNRLSFSWNGAPEQANDYVRSIEKLGYGVKPYDSAVQQSESQKEERFLLLCLGAAGFAMGNIMLLSVGLWVTSTETMGISTRDLMHFIQAFIGIPTIFYAGRPFFRSAFAALSNGHTNMDVPISLALVLASGMSLFETFNHGEHVYFDSAVMLMFFLLIGRYLDFRARKKAQSTATDLLSTIQGFATVIDGHKIKKILIRDLQEDMQVQVSVGEKFPVDGVVEVGESDIDTSLVTGETMPRSACVGDNIYAGTMNLSAPIQIRVAKAAEDSLLADIVRLMEQAEQGQAAYVRIADRAAKLYTPFVHSMAALAFFGWFFVGGLAWQDALMIAITVLIITCPCALGLAVPVVQVLATGRLLKNNILVKSGDALERLASIKTILFDKTGTLTVGQPQLQEGYSEKDLKLAASIASNSKHPLSKALCYHYKGDYSVINDIEEIAGKGLSGSYQGKKIKLGSRRWCGDASSDVFDKIELWLSLEGSSPSVFYFEDQLREDAAIVIEKLKNVNLTPIMLSGDRQVIANKIANLSGIEEIYAEKTPVEKYQIMEELRADDHKIMMVGDGLNDAPTLAGADVSMAPSTAIDMAQNAADIVFMGKGLSPVYEAYQVAVKTQKLVKQNFALAILYNCIAVPLALGGFVTPLIAAIAMSGSSLIVIANSFRLKLSS
jgi:Cu2+-exporting ATPase